MVVGQILFNESTILTARQVLWYSTIIILVQEAVTASAQHRGRFTMVGHIIFSSRFSEPAYRIDAAQPFFSFGGWLQLHHSR